MTSDKAVSPTSEQIYLDYALGRNRARLSGLSDAEFAGLLHEQLYSIDLGVLRGFKRLREVLARRSDDECINIAPECTCTMRGEGELTLDTHVVRAGRGTIDQEIVYRRSESDETTTDWHVANSWGRSAYKSRGTESVLLLVRLPNRRNGAENLVHVTYSAVKVPHKSEYLITSIVGQAVPVAGFRAHFGDRAATIARDMIWEMRSVISRTCDDLAFHEQEMRKRLNQWEHLGNSISE